MDVLELTAKLQHMGLPAGPLGLDITLYKASGDELHGRQRCSHGFTRGTPVVTSLTELASQADRLRACPCVADALPGDGMAFLAAARRLAVALGSLVGVGGSLRADQPCGPWAALGRLEGLLDAADAASVAPALPAGTAHRVEALTSSARQHACQLRVQAEANPDAVARAAAPLLAPRCLDGIATEVEARYGNQAAKALGEVARLWPPAMLTSDAEVAQVAIRNVLNGAVPEDRLDEAVLLVAGRLTDEVDRVCAEPELPVYLLLDTLGGGTTLPYGPSHLRYAVMARYPRVAATDRLALYQVPRHVATALATCVTTRPASGVYLGPAVEPADDVTLLNVVLALWERPSAGYRGPIEPMSDLTTAFEVSRAATAPAPAVARLQTR